MRLPCALTTILLCLVATTACSADDAAALLKVIQSTDASDNARANAFEKIGDIAGEEAVGPLAAFLTDEKWSHYARYALQKMDGEMVTKTLLKSLDALEGNLKIGVIVTIGRRHDPIAVAPLAKLLAHTDAEIARAAAIALGQIGTTESSAALADAFNSANDADRKAALASALILVGQQLAKAKNTADAVRAFDLVRHADVPKPYLIGATQNAILARGAGGVDLMAEQLKSSDPDYFEVGLAVSRVLPGEQATDALIQSLDAESSPNRQALLLLATRDRGDRRALAAVTQRLTSDSLAVRLAAIQAVGALGDAQSVPGLLSVAGGETEEAVLDALVALQDPKVNASLISAAQTSNASAIAVKALGQRRATEAVELLFQLAESDSPKVRQEAIVALGRTVTQDRFGDLVAMLSKATDGSRKKAIQDAIHAAVFRSTDPDACAEALGAMIPRSRGADREFLFEQIRTAGGTKAVALMREFALGPDESLQDAATKTLGTWLSADAAPVLLEVAKGGGKFANRALGGYIRIFRQFELPESERVAMAAEALKAARRANERNAAIEAMTRFPCVGTFQLALDQLDVPGSEEAAAKAILTIGRTVLDLDPDVGKAGLEKLIKADISPSITNSAKALLR